MNPRKIRLGLAQDYHSMGLCLTQRRAHILYAGCFVYVSHGLYFAADAHGSVAVSTRGLLGRRIISWSEPPAGTIG
jgi:hypothetical protein